MADEKRPRFSYRSPGVLDLWAYAGTLEEAGQAIANYLSADLPELADGEAIEIEVKRHDLTDAEVEALPEI
jgi:hypothetical protein